MNKCKLLVLVAMSFAFYGLDAQLYVDNIGRIGVATQNMTGGKTRIENTDQERTLYLNNTRDVSTTNYGLYNSVGPNGTGKKYGSYNNVIGNAYQPSSKYLYGGYSYVSGGANEWTYGTYNYVTGGTGRKYGSYNYVTQGIGGTNTYGQFNSTTVNGGSTSYGIYSSLSGSGTGTRYGMYLLYTDYASNNSTKYGIYNKVRHYSTSLVFGNYTNVYTTNTANSNNVYGNIINVGGGGTGYRYGVYSTINGYNGVAGYFNGDLVYTGQLNPSDASLKENVRSIDNAVDIVKSLEPKKYRYKEDQAFHFNTDKDSYGFIAQEFEVVLPDLVGEIRHPGIHNITEGEHKEGSTIVNDEGHVEPGDSEEMTPDVIEEGESTNYKGINYVELIPILTQAIKEQQDQIEELERNSTTKSAKDLTKVINRLDVLESENAELRKRIASLENCTDCKDASSIDSGSSEINTAFEKTYVLYPNPADNLVTIRQNGKEAFFSAVVFDTSGKKVTAETSEGKTIKLHTNTWQPGTYLINVLENGVQVSQERVVIVH